LPTYGIIFPSLYSKKIKLINDIHIKQVCYNALETKIYWEVDIMQKNIASMSKKELLDLVVQLLEERGGKKLSKEAIIKKLESGKYPIQVKKIVVVDRTNKLGQLVAVLDGENKLRFYVTNPSNGSLKAYKYIEASEWQEVSRLVNQLLK